ncbi:MAG: hypothetical protein V1721_09170 [Pseudomonadota bacterium]
MKRVVFLLVGAVFLLGFGQFQGSPRLTHPAYAAGKAEKVDPDAPHPEFEYLQLDPLSLPVITAKGLTQQVSLMVSLEVDYGQKEKISLYKPRLTDAYIQDLYGALGTGHALMQGNLVDVRQVKKRLSSVTERVLGTDIKVHDVLLQVVQQRRM